MFAGTALRISGLYFVSDDTKAKNVEDLFLKLFDRTDRIMNYAMKINVKCCKSRTLHLPQKR